MIEYIIYEKQGDSITVLKSYYLTDAIFREFEFRDCQVDISNVLGIERLMVVTRKSVNDLRLDEFPKIKENIEATLPLKPLTDLKDTSDGKYYFTIKENNDD